MKKWFWFLFLLPVAFCHGAGLKLESVPSVQRSGLGNTQKKLTSAEPTRIAYMGGSITEQEGWRVLTQEWFKENYPDAELVEIPAGLGGTNSELGAYRVGRDVIQHNPDLVFIEFAVNNGVTQRKPLTEAMEGIIRQIWKANPATDICFVYTISDKFMPYTEEGKYFSKAAAHMEKIADHYGIPSINMAYEVPKLAADGKLLLHAKKPTTKEEEEALDGKILFAGDGVHPYIATGHPVYFEQVQAALPGFLEAEPEEKRKLPNPMEPNNLEDAQMVPISSATLDGNWQKIDFSQADHLRRVESKTSELWQASEKGDTLSFRFRGTHAGLYGVLGPDSGVFTASVDGKSREQIMFDKYCAYPRMTGVVLASGLDGEEIHRVEIEYLDKKLDKEELLLEEERRKDFRANPAKYEKQHVYVGAILLRGEIVHDE